MKTCADFGHPENPHHHHCYHCGRMSENHRSWCPDYGSKPDVGMVGAWAYSKASQICARYG